MSFPATIEGRNGDQFANRADKTNIPLGTIMKLPDGREFIYSRAGAVNLDIGKVMQQAVVTSGHDVDLAVAAAAAIGATTVTITNSTTAITENMYAEGTLFVNDGPGQGQTCKIKSHPAESTGSGSCVITLEDEDALTIALTTASKVGLRKHQCDGVVVAPTTFTGVVVGVTVCDVTAEYYCWLLRKGLQAVLGNGTLVLGKAVTRSETTPGAVDVYPLNSVDASGQQPMIGTVATVGGSTDYSLVLFDL